MSLSSTAVNRDTTAVDYLNYLRNYANSQQAGTVAGTNIIPDYTLQLSDAIHITDSIAQDTTNSLLDAFDVSDDLQNNNQPTGSFVIDVAQIDFSDVG